MNLVNKGNCGYCGEEVDMARLDDDFICDACRDYLKAQDEPYDESPLCSACNGSGEGMYDGTRCSSCGGSGVVNASKEEAWDDDLNRRYSRFSD